MSKRTIVPVVMLSVVLICFLVYLRALDCGFVNYDDPEYLLENTGIRSLDGDFWPWAFLTMPLNTWTPLLFLSYAVDYRFWGLNPFGYHLTNSLLHAVNAGLVVLIVDRVCRYRRPGNDGHSSPHYWYPLILLLAGLLFGIHPARVESVAWVSERKDVLNGVFAFGSVWCYLRYLHRKDASQGKAAILREYCLALLLFALSLMAKPSTIFLPVMLLVMDWYPLERWQKGRTLPLVAEKVPFMVLSVLVVAVNVFGRVQQHGFNSLASFPLAVRLVASGTAVVEYFKLMLFPIGILPYYALPRPIPDSFIFTAIVVACFLCSLLFWGKRYPWFTAAVLSFIIMLVPSLHFMADGAQLLKAARYTYLPSLLPVIIMAVVMIEGVPKGAGSWSRQLRVLIGGLMVALLVFYAVTTQRLIGDWHDAGTMWTKVIAHEPFDKAYFFRGRYYADQGNFGAAIEDYTTCLMQATTMTIPQLHNVYAYRGDVLTRAGFHEEAAADFSTAIAMFPHPLYFYHRGLILQRLGRSRAASEDFNRAGPETGAITWLE